ncbi:FUSC family protein [Lewinella sp. IMCC34191]|uniref:FUSC family protein n=1 Tax=Lewinella sp. IMCC34191 TaxID=2259172 RepID=UPI000E288662|nr:FUSC family protein [Lewinella sp. IMCC34191]
MQAKSRFPDSIRRRVVSTLKDHGFGRGILIVVAIVVAIAVVSALFDLPTAVSTALGIFLVSICDLPGNKVAHVANQLIGLLLAVTNIVLIQYALSSTYLSLVVLPCLVFVSAYISVLGKRASLVSFSGLLALVLAYAFPQTGWQVLESALAITCGGLWFILLNLLVHPVRYRQYRIGLLNDLLRLTAKYLALKAEQLRSDDPDAHWQPLISLHNSISENRKELTEYFFATDPETVTRSGQNHEAALFLELVELIELAAALPLRGEVGRRSEAVKSVADVVTQIATALTGVADKSHGFRTTQPEELRKRVHALAPPEDTEGGNRNTLQHYLTILVNNVERQLEKLQHIESLGEREPAYEGVPYEEEAYRRLRPRINWEGLRESFTTEDAVFRHSLRLAAVVTLGYLIGQALGVQNAYWIMLTVVVILRPSYVQSKDRSLERTVGTLIGAVVAASVVFLTDSYLVYGAVAALSLPFMFVYLNKDYRIAALFVTLNLVFVYAMLHPNAYTVIAYRVIDTVIGAALAWLASRLLWPSWERKGIKKLLTTALEGMRAYLVEEAALFRSGQTDGLEYRLARRQAFVGLGELEATYSRVLREPGGAAAQTDRLSAVVTDAHRILSVVAHIGTLLRYSAGKLDPTHVDALTHELADNIAGCNPQAAGDQQNHAESPPDTAAAQAYFRQGGSNESSATFLLEYDYLQNLVADLKTDIRRWEMTTSSPAN